MNYETVANYNYKWACQGTSVNPNPSTAKYMTTYVSGTASTLCTSGCTVTGSASIMMSVLIFVIALIATFYY